MPHRYPRADSASSVPEGRQGGEVPHTPLPDRITGCGVAHGDVQSTPQFRVDGEPVASVTAEEMAEVDRVATDDVGLHLLSMMENAGRALAATVREQTPGDERVTVLAGGGGNGGGGLVAARHLANAGRAVHVVLDRDREAYDGVPARQLGVLDATSATVGTALPADDGETDPSVATDAISRSGTVVDALVGYGLQSAARGRVAELIEAAPAFDRVVSLDVPSGTNATTGERPGVAVDPDAVVTLALPKPGLAAVAGNDDGYGRADDDGYGRDDDDGHGRDDDDGRGGNPDSRDGNPDSRESADFLLADIGIPAGVYERAGIDYTDPFGSDDRVPLTVAE